MREPSWLTTVWVMLTATTNRWTEHTYNANHDLARTPRLPAWYR